MDFRRHGSGAFRAAPFGAAGIPRGMVRPPAQAQPRKASVLVPLVLGLAVGGAAVGIKYMMVGFKRLNAMRKAAADASASRTTTQSSNGAAGKATTGTGERKKATLFGNFGKKFYEGGFEEQMTRREAALILGCRETSSKQRVMDRYRRLMVLNHPDAGGSPFVAAKVNEAKDMLVARARDEAKFGGKSSKRKSQDSKKEDS